MWKKLPPALLLIASASPALASEEGPFFSMQNPPFMVLVGFLLFVALVLFLKVPKLLGGMLEKRAEGIRGELDEARALREEAQSLLASYERKQKEVKEQAERIVAHAKEEAGLAAEQAREDLKASIARRLAAAEEQIASARENAVKEVRDAAVAVAVGAASDVIASKLGATEANKLIDAAIKDAQARLH